MACYHLRPLQLQKVVILSCLQPNVTKMGVVPNSVRCVCFHAQGIRGAIRSIDFYFEKGLVSVI